MVHLLISGPIWNTGKGWYNLRKAQDQFELEPKLILNKSVQGYSNRTSVLSKTIETRKKLRAKIKFNHKEL